MFLATHTQLTVYHVYGCCHSNYERSKPKVQNLEDVFSRYYMHSNIFSVYKPQYILLATTTIAKGSLHLVLTCMTTNSSTVI